MSETIEIMGISLEKCYAADVMESIDEHWNSNVLATYGTITMKLLMEAQNDEELKGYVEGLDKAVVDEPEVIRAAGITDEQMLEDATGHGFFGTLFWLLNQYKNRIFILGDKMEDVEKFCNYLQEKYPQIVIAGKDSLEEAGADHEDRVINEINGVSPHAVLSCSRTYETERFVKRKRKMLNTGVWFSLGSCLEIFNETGVKAGWLNRLMEKSNFKKMISEYKDKTEKM